VRHYLLCIAIFSFTACNVTRESELDSELQGYTSSELKNNSKAWKKAEEAVCLLDKNGWSEIPEQYLPSGYSHSDLLRYMACVANKESVFGGQVYGPNTGCGNAYGYWQIASCHMGRSVPGMPQYRCPATNVNALANNFDFSAKCALYVYMEAASKGRRGMAPWEATCTRREWLATRADGQPLFPPSCGSSECVKKIKMTQNRDEFNISMPLSCSATHVEAVLLLANGSNVLKVSEPLKSNLEESDSFKVTKISLGNFDRVFNRIRIMLYEGKKLIWTSNPSPTIDLNFPAEY
jgi:hypothetical protein